MLPPQGTSARKAKKERVNLSLYPPDPRTHTLHTAPHLPPAGCVGVRPKRQPARSSCRELASTSRGGGGAEISCFVTSCNHHLVSSFFFLLKSLQEIVTQNVELAPKAYFVHGPLGIQSLLADEVRGNQPASATGTRVVFSRAPGRGEHCGRALRVKEESPGTEQAGAPQLRPAARNPTLQGSPVSGAPSLQFHRILLWGTNHTYHPKIVPHS